jgi:acyl dehydratase
MTEGKKYFEDYEIGEVTISSRRLMTDADIRLFIGCTDNTHQVHVDPHYCAQFPEIKRPVVQGLLVLGVADGFMAREVSCSKGVPSMHYGHEKIRYIKPVYAGDSVYCKFEVVDKEVKNDAFGIITFNCTVMNQDDEAVIFNVDKQFIGRKP